MGKFNVIKIGGSALKSASDLERIARVVELYDHSVVIVLSAFYGVTDQLDRVFNNPENIYQEGEKMIKQLKEMKSKIINQAFEYSDENDKMKLKHKLNNRFDKLDKCFLAAHCLGEVPVFIKNDILSYGESLSSLIVSAFLQSKGIDIQEYLPEEIPLKTDGVFGNASIDCETTAVSLREKLNGHSAVIPGFYGISDKGRKTLLGRGGSDYSAACIAYCLKAESVDIWKDVNGFLSANPQLIEKAVEIPHLSYDEASEIAYFGSEILHPRTAEPLRSDNIPIRIYNFKELSSWPEPHTLINEKKQVSEEIIKSISYSDDFAIIKLTGAGVGIKPGVLAKVTHTLDEHGINIKSVLTSQISINLLLDTHDAIRAKELLESVKIKSVENVLLTSNISVIAAIGEGVVNHDGLASGIFTTVARKGINVEMICFGASSVAAYFVVKAKHRKETVNAIHDYYFNTNKKKKIKTQNVI